MVFAPFIPTRCWIAPEMPTATYTLRRHRLAGTPHLPFHRQPPVVADRPRRRQFGAKRLGEFLHHRQMLILLLDPAAHRDDDLRRC